MPKGLICIMENNQLPPKAVGLLREILGYNSISEASLLPDGREVLRQIGEGGGFPVFVRQSERTIISLPHKQILEGGESRKYIGASVTERAGRVGYGSYTLVFTDPLEAIPSCDYTLNPHEMPYQAFREHLNAGDYRGWWFLDRVTGELNTVGDTDGAWDAKRLYRDASLLCSSSGELFPEWLAREVIKQL